MIIFEAKVGPKMDPGGLQKRVRTTVGHRATDLTQAGGRKIPQIDLVGTALDRRAYFWRPGPLGRPRARGLEKKKNTTRPLHRILHASAQRAGESI